MLKTLIITMLGALLVACQPAPESYRPTPFAFETQVVTPLQVQVARIELITQYQSSLKPPNIEQDFPVLPSKAVAHWLSKRLQATGQVGTLQITINDASVIEKPLKKTDGIKGLFTNDQDAQYDARISVTYRLFDGHTPTAIATGDVEVTRMMTMNEKITIFERQKHYHAMLDAMLNDFERETHARLKQYFSNYL